MALINDNVVDQNKVPVCGAKVYVYGGPDILADLTDSMGQPIENPVVTGEGGYWEANAPDGYYTLKYYWGGRERLIVANYMAGTPSLGPNADLNLRADLYANNGGTLVGIKRSSAAVRRDAFSILQDRPHIRDYGAKLDFDGISTGTDDTTAFRNALTELRSEARELTMGAGNMLITGPCSMSINATGGAPAIRGEGSNATKLWYRPTDTSKDMLTITGNMPNEDMFKLSGMLFLFPENGALGLTNAGAGLRLKNHRNFVIEDVQSYRAGYGIALEGCLVGKIERHHSIFDRTALYMDQGSYAGTGSISGTKFTPATITLGTVAVGKTIDGPNVTAGTSITADNGDGTWTVSPSQTALLGAIAGSYQSGPNAILLEMCEYQNARTGVDATRYSQIVDIGGANEGCGLEGADIVSTATFATNVMTVSAHAGSVWVPGDHIYATQSGTLVIQPSTRIVKQLTSTESGGALGKRGTYQLDRTVGTVTTCTVTMMGTGYHSSAAGLNGPRGLSVFGKYLEANYGYDVLLEHYDAPTFHSFRDCNFDRTTLQQHASIMLDFGPMSVGSSLIGLNTDGSAFRRYVSSPSATTPFIDTYSTTGFNNIKSAGSAYFSNDTERPTKLGYTSYGPPTAAAHSGTITSQTATGQYKEIGNSIVDMSVDNNLITVSGLDYYTINLPFPARTYGDGRIQALSVVVSKSSSGTPAIGTLGSAIIADGASVATVRLSAAFANNITVTTFGTYER